MRRVPIRMKLAAALTVPMLGLFLITVVEMVETSREVDDVRSQTALARGALGPSGLITTLQNERTWAVVELIGSETLVQPVVVGYEATRRDTDRAINAFRDTLRNESAAVGAAYEDALANLDGLVEVRKMIDGSDAPRDLGNVELSDEVFEAYADMIRPFLDANTRVALAVDDAELRQLTSLVDTTTRQVETISELARSSILDIVVGDGINEADEIAATASIRSVFDGANQEILAAGAPYDELVATWYPAEMVNGFSAALDTALAGGDVQLDALLGPLDVPTDAGYMGLRDHLVTALHDRADELNSQAEERERLYLVLGAVTMTVAIALTWLVSRSITRPLRVLTQQARTMAEHRLPGAVTDILTTPLGENITVPRVDPVRVRTRDEVADVADALNTVQDTALDLAVEQAVLRRNIADSFVNLGRRNQNLLGRQLDFITELESNEGDPDTLANLFRLDHLATRMRRNAESLLVLAGVEPPRQWAAPVRITDVIRAALGEVESYQRVAVRGVEAATILGSAAADLAHLLAELIENALVFSPPDRSVDVRGRMREDGGYTLAIIDSGLGMPPADITAANRRLAGAESFTVAPSKYLGHYVAGNLAARHGIDVRLDNSPGNGITATITVPPTLLTTDEVTSAPVTPPHGQRAVRAPALPASLPAPGHRPAAAPEPTPTGGVPFGPGPGAGQHPPTAPSPSEPVPSWAAPLPPAAPRQRPPATGTPDPWAPHHDQRAPVPDVPPPWAAADPHAGAPFPPGGGHHHTTPGRPVPEPPAPPAPTRSGLARRTPVPRVLSAPPPAEDAALLSALGRYAPGARSGPARPVEPSASGTSRDRPRDTSPLPHRADAAQPGPPGPSDSPFTPPDALTRRVKGAQLPRSTVVSLHGEGRQGSGHRAARGPAPEASRAADVQSLLSSFTAGVQRGLDEARQRAAATGTGPVQVVDLRTEHGSPGHA